MAIGLDGNGEGFWKMGELDGEVLTEGELTAD